MATRNLPVNRTAVGFIALGCLLTSVLLWSVMQAVPDRSALVFFQGGLLRAGLVTGALWLALPTRSKDAAWANLSPQTVIGLLLALVVSTRIRLHVLIPAALLVGILLLILRPRPKHRPSTHAISHENR